VPCDTVTDDARRTVLTAPTWRVAEWFGLLGFDPGMFADLNNRHLRGILVHALAGEPEATPNTTDDRPEAQP